MKRVCCRIINDLLNYKWAIVFLGLYNVCVRYFFKAYCPMLIFCGLPCAGCGMTRAIFYIMTGRVKRGMVLNPAAPLWILFFFYAFINRYLREKKGKIFYLILSIACVMTIAMYLYRMLTQFPGNPPMVFYKNNFISRFVKYLKCLEY